MSIEAVKWAMDDAPMLRTPAGKADTTARHVLQALAEHASKTGTNTHPSEIRLQYRTGYDRRTVQRALRRLEDAKLIIPDGTVQDRNRYRLAMNIVRDPSDWDALEREEQDSRAAATERQRRARARRVTHSNDVTVTDSPSVTEPDVTHSESARRALQMRDVTHFKSGRHALSAAVTTNEPPVEPPATQMAGVGGSTYGPRGLAPSAPIDDDGFALTDALRRWARRDGYDSLVDIDHETAQFLDHYRATGERRANWPAAWQKWIRQAHKWATERRQRPNGNVIQLPSGQTLTGTDARVAGWLALPSEEAP
ncbi:helix-turn-helix domain-containing protein [Streptomyces sp. NPDC059835]|uniref:helix-turn-helix domain-containing protein n=1 Tax=Streptomyces sp. NPDC059835 TaxID=3346967 RepID=UPI00365D6633